MAALCADASARVDRVTTTERLGPADAARLRPLVLIIAARHALDVRFESTGGVVTIALCRSRAA